jgi:hypothetical protein
MNKLYEDVLAEIKRCEESFARIGTAAQVYIDNHDEYVERVVMDATLIKKKMIEKIVRVINED